LGQEDIYGLSTSSRSLNLAGTCLGTVTISRYCVCIFMPHLADYSLPSPLPNPAADHILARPGFGMFGRPTSPDAGNSAPQVPELSLTASLLSTGTRFGTPLVEHFLRPLTTAVAPTAEYSCNLASRMTTPGVAIRQSCQTGMFKLQILDRFPRGLAESPL
jgi:hypothetical protein